MQATVILVNGWYLSYFNRGSGPQVLCNGDSTHPNRRDTDEICDISLTKSLRSAALYEDLGEAAKIAEEIGGVVISLVPEGLVECANS